MTAVSQNVIPLTAHAVPARSKAERFRALLASPQLEFIMEAHNGLSAKIVEETGFKGIWASGLSLATAMGVRDRNEASWTQVLEVLEFMAEATTIPILLDGDTGYGDFNNFRRLVKKLCQRGVGAVCIEDKVFPKTNSLIDGDQALADVDEFCGKIKAGKDSQTDDDFSIIARVEALIAGWGLDEALRRAEAYRAAGADGILIHSKRSGPDEILAFAREWANRAPLVIVPTTYYATPTERFREAEVSLIIWANHNLRAALTAMRETSRQIFAEQTLVGVEGKVAGLKDVFGIADNTELIEAERKYLGMQRLETKAVVLAASRGSALEALTRDKPKCMLDLRGEPLLRRLVRSFNDAGVRDITVVCGYKHEAVDLPNIRKVVNDNYATTGEAASLACALDLVEGPTLISYGDILFRDYILDLLFDAPGDIVLAVDAKWHENSRDSRKAAPDLVMCSQPYREDLFLDDMTVELHAVDGPVSRAEAHGEWIGLARVTAGGLEAIRREIDAMAEDGSLYQASLPDVFDRLARRGKPPQVVYITGHWLDVNDAFDLAWARNVL
jgi:phosphoenolpyruvate phosphomutase